MQQSNYAAAEVVYHKAQQIDPDANKSLNLCLCLIKQQKCTEARFALEEILQGKVLGSDDSKLRARAEELMMELEPWLLEPGLLTASSGGSSLEDAFVEGLDKLMKQWTPFRSKRLPIFEEISPFRDQLACWSFLVFFFTCELWDFDISWSMLCIQICVIEWVTIYIYMCTTYLAKKGFLFWKKNNTIYSTPFRDQLGCLSLFGYFEGELDLSFLPCIYRSALCKEIYNLSLVFFLYVIKRKEKKRSYNIHVLRALLFNESLFRFSSLYIFTWKTYLLWVLLFTILITWKYVLIFFLKTPYYLILPPLKLYKRTCDHQDTRSIYSENI